MIEYQAAGGTQVFVLPGGLKLVLREMPELIHGWILQWRKGEGRLVLDVTALHQSIPVTHVPNTCMPTTSSHSHPPSQPIGHWTPTPLIRLMRFFTLNTPPARLLLSIATHTTHATPVPTHPHALAPALAAPSPQSPPNRSAIKGRSEMMFIGEFLSVKSWTRAPLNPELYKQERDGNGDSWDEV